MLELNSDDIALLFSTIIVLPNDRKVELKEEIGSTKAESNALESSPHVSNTEKSEESIPTQKAEVKKPANHPFIILTNSTLKQQLLSDSSNFSKIIGALNISNTSKYISTLDANSAEKATYKCIWCIGLTSEEEMDIKKQNHNNILFSPNTENLQSKEEKLAMFTPLKEFVNLNFGVLSNL